MWIGWLFVQGQWVQQPSTCSRDLGTCSARLGVLAASVGLPATHQMMTGGAPPIGIVPPSQRSEIRSQRSEVRKDLEGEEP